MLFLSRYSYDSEIAPATLQVKLIVTSEGSEESVHQVRLTKTCQDQDQGDCHCFCQDGRFQEVGMAYCQENKIQGCLCGIDIPLEDFCQRNLSHLVSYAITCKGKNKGSTVTTPVGTSVVLENSQPITRKRRAVLLHIYACIKYKH